MTYCNTTFIKTFTLIKIIIIKILSHNKKIVQMVKKKLNNQ